MEHEFSVAWAEVTIDCRDPRRLAAFWSSLLDVGLDEPPLPGWARTRPTVPGGPVLNFQPVPETKAGKARLHLDLWADDLDATVDWIHAHGGGSTGEVHYYKEGTVVIMTDPEGTEFCVVGPPGTWRD